MLCWPTACLLTCGWIRFQANGYCFGSVEERNLKVLMSSAFGNTDFEYSKNFDVRETFMRGSDEQAAGDGDGDGPIKKRRERLGNDLDELDIGPDFQV